MEIRMIRNFKLHAAHVKKSGSDRCFYMICYSVVVLCLLIVLLPMMYVLAASFSSAAAVNAGKVWLWPVDFSLKGYETVLQYKSVWIGYKNTIIYTLCGTLINVAVTMLCAYPLSRKELGGRTFFTFLFSFTMLFSGGLIPTYILIRDLRMINTVWAMLLPGAMSVYNMIIARVFIESSIPGDLLEASRLDGASDAQYFFHVVLPLSKAVIAVIALYYAVGHWNSFFNAFIYLNDKVLYPLQLFLRDILVQNNIDSSDITDPEMAAQIQGLATQLKYPIIVISTLPMVCLYPFVQKHFNKGVMVGSLKG